MIVSHRHRFVFIKTRKTASTSVEIALSRHCGPEDVVTPITPEDEELRSRLGGVGAQNHEPPAFPVRAYNHLGCRAVRAAVGADTWDDYFTFAVERNPWDTVVSSYHFAFRHRPAVPFSEFVHGGLIRKLAGNQGKIRAGGAVVVEHVCRYENLAADVRAVWERIGLPGTADLPSAKSGFRASRDYRSYYGTREREYVARLFRRTIRDFGYEF